MQELVDIARRVATWPMRRAPRSSSTTSSARPVFSKPLEQGADIVVYSATKHIDGQGRVLGGAVLGHQRVHQRAGQEPDAAHRPGMSPFNAWVLLKGLETMGLRVREAGGQRAGRRRGPGRPPGGDAGGLPVADSAPADELAKPQMPGGGTVVTFEIDGGQGRGVRAHERTAGRRHQQQPRRREVDGHPPGDHDAPPAHRGGSRAVGITAGTIRISVGLEDVRDLVEDLDQAELGLHPVTDRRSADDVTVTGDEVSLAGACAARSRCGSP